MGPHKPRPPISPRSVLNPQASFASSSSGAGSIFGKPFTFGKPLAFERQPPSYLQELALLNQPRVLAKQWPADLQPKVAFTVKHSGKRRADVDQPSQTGNHVIKSVHQRKAPARTKQCDGADEEAVSDGGNQDPCSEVPGPGYYDIVGALAKQHRGPAFTIGMRPAVKPQSADSSQRQAACDQEACNPTCTGRSAAFTMGHAFPKQPGFDTPGPGAYGVPKKPEPRAPAYSFPTTSSVAPGALELRPGVGQYDVVMQASAGPAFTMPSTGRQPNTIRTHMAPTTGPGHYDPVDAHHAPAWGFGKAPDEVADLAPVRAKPEAHVPPVGAYTLPTAWKDGPAFSMGGKPASATAKQTKAAPPPVPGPGHYQAEVPGTAGPAFSMGIKHAEKDMPGSPGPAGPYQRSTYEPAGPAFTILGRVDSSTPRKAAAVPGPGAYQQTPTKRGPAFTIASRPTHIKPAVEVPGVGAYEVAVLSKAPAFTIAARPTAAGTGVDENQPGPGAYAVSAGKPDTPAFTFGYRREPPDQAVSDMPGPGDDTAEERQAWLDGPAYTISHVGREEGACKAAETPGPGEYAADHDALERKAPSFAFTMSARPPPVTTADTPAPGAYSTADPNPGPAFTIAARPAAKDTAAVSTPGPGEYDGAAASHPEGPSFSIGVRAASTAKSASLVGPGQYDVAVSALDGPAFTIAGRPKAETPAEPLPGPAHYADAPLPGTPAFTIGIRRDEAGTTSATPAVGTYHPKDMAHKAMPAYTMPKSERQPAQTEVLPGPGDYIGQKAVSEGPAFSLPQAQRPQLAAAGADLPAPGDYHADVRLGHEAPAFTIAPRLPSSMGKVSAGPGPADYVPPALPAGPAFTAAGRIAPPDRAMADTPGPADYRAADYGASQAGPAFTIAARYPPSRALEQLAAQPGPGAHDPVPVVPNKAPAFSIGSRTKLPVADDPADLPAPGDYHQASTGRQGPAYSLPSASRTVPSLSQAANSPAPGDYHVDHAASKPKHQQKPRPLSKPGRCKQPDDTPGPADFDPKLQKSSAPAYTIGKRVRQSALADKENSCIGPEYEVLKPSRSPAYTIAAKPAMPVLEPTPGPGQYNQMRDFPHPLGKAVSILKKTTKDAQASKWKHVSFAPPESNQHAI